MGEDIYFWPEKDEKKGDGHPDNGGENRHRHAELQTWDGIFKLLRSPGIDSKESIPPASVAWQAGTTTLFLLIFSLYCSKIPAMFNIQK